MMFVTFLLAMTSQTAWAQEPTFSGGEGTPENPYKISSAADLEQLAADVNNGETSYEEFYFIVTQDITYDYASLGENESNFQAIGGDGYPFKGHFDGNGNTISGIRIYKSDGEGRQGLFGVIIAPAVVENVTLTDTRITAGAQTGGIVGDNKGGEIINCHVTNTVEILGNEDYSAYGGIVGTNGPNDTAEFYGTVSGCISEATLSIVSGFYYGGIAGENSGTLENNFVIGATIPTAIFSNNHGAIVGYNEGTLANNYYTACTVAGVENATNVGVGIDNNDQPVGDVTENDGALSVHQIILAEGVTGVTINAEAAYSYGSKDYYAQGTTVKLTYTGTPGMGYEFIGINAGEGVTGTLSDNVYTITMPANDVTVASVDIKAITYTITYEGVDGVTMPEGTVKEYTVGTADFKLPESLEKDHYVFTGWTYEGQEDPILDVIIAEGSTGDKTFTANWRSMEEPNPAVVEKEASVAIGGETYYELAQEVKEAVKENFNTEIALSAEASNRVEVTAEGSLKFSQGPSATVALPEMNVKVILKIIFDGNIKAPVGKLHLINKIKTRGGDDTSSDAVMELVSGAEYEVIEDGDLVLTIVLEEEEAVIEGITVTEPEPEPTPEEVPVTITKAGQVPYYSEYNLDFTDKPDLKAYVATGYDKAKGTIWLTRVKQVPAETGFLLIGDQGDYDIPTIDGVSDVYYKNMFKGTLEGTTIQTTDGDYTNYYLSSGASGVGFYKVTNPDGQKIGANRCYLPILTDIPANGSEGDAEVIKVSAAKQVPYYTSKNIDFSSLEAQGVKAYTATGYNYESGIIWLTRVKKVPAKTGILVMADAAGEYSVPTTSVQSVYENMFTGSETAQTIYTTETVGDIEYINYYLSNGTSGIGFYKVTNEDGVSMAANRSYLQIPKREKASGARGMDGNASFSKMVISDDDDDVITIPLFAGDATGIISTQFQNADQEVYYNLQGQRIDRPRKGLYIRNGKKIVIRSTTK